MHLEVVDPLMILTMVAVVEAMMKKAVGAVMKANQMTQVKSIGKELKISNEATNSTSNVRLSVGKGKMQASNLLIANTKARKGGRNTLNTGMLKENNILRTCMKLRCPMRARSQMINTILRQRFLKHPAPVFTIRTT